MAIELSKLKPHPHNSVELEQYATEGDLAAFWLLAIDQLDNLEDKSVVDLGSGNGILGLGTVFLGAKKVLLVEADEEACLISNQNSEKINQQFSAQIETIHASIGSQELEAPKQTDIVVMNPPWGRQTPRADRPFLDTSVRCANESIHLLHGRGAKHIESWAESSGWFAKKWMEVDLPMPPIYSHHTKKRSTTEAAMWWIKRSAN